MKTYKNIFIVLLIKALAFSSIASAQETQETVWKERAKSAAPYVLAVVAGILVAVSVKHFVLDSEDPEANPPERKATTPRRPRIERHPSVTKPLVVPKIGDRPHPQQEEPKLNRKEPSKKDKGAPVQTPLVPEQQVAPLKAKTGPEKQKLQVEIPLPLDPNDIPASTKAEFTEKSLKSHFIADFVSPQKAKMEALGTIQAAIKYKSADPEKRVAVLNFANRYQPLAAQEGAIIAATMNLKASLDELRLEKQKTPANEAYIGQHDVVYTPDVFLTPEVLAKAGIQGNMQIDVFSAGAYDLRSESEEAGTGEVYLENVKKKWRMIFKSAEREQVDVFIVGAIGCGVFENPPEKVAQAAREVIAERPWRFKIVFAIPGKKSKNYQAFANAL